MVANNKKWTYEIVKSIVEDKGYKLIKFYEPCFDNNHKPKVLISNGYEEKLMYFDNFKRGKFSFKSKTDKVVKEYVEKIYNIKLDYIKLIKLGKKNDDDLLELSYGNKVIRRTIGSIYSSIKSKSFIFTDKRIEPWTETEVINYLSQSKFNLSNIKLVYNTDKPFNVRRCRIYFTYDKCEFDSSFKALKNRLETGDESILSINKGETFYKNLLLKKFNINNIGFKRIYKCILKSQKCKKYTFMADIYNLDTGEEVCGVLTDNLKKRGYWFSTSSGEFYVKNELDKLNVIYERQKTFDDCKYKDKLRFDFYLPKYNTLIEYDGELHYKSIDYFGGEDNLQYQQTRDKLKDEYCKLHNIKLIRIPYYNFKQIPNIIQDIVSTN